MVDYRPKKTAIKIGEGPIYIYVVITTYPDKTEITHDHLEYFTESLIERLNDLPMVEHYESRVRDRDVFITKTDGFIAKGMATLRVDSVTVQKLHEVQEIMRGVAKDVPDMKLSRFDIASEGFAEQFIQTSGG